MSLHVVQHPFATFDNCHIPTGGMPPIGVIGEDGNGLSESELTCVEELIGEQLAINTMPKRQQWPKYTNPLHPVSRILRGYMPESDGGLELLDDRLVPLTTATPEDGKVHMEADGNRVRVTWQASLCFGGVGAVAQSRAVATYKAVKGQRGNPTRIERTVKPGYIAVKTNDLYAAWAKDNYLDAHLHRVNIDKKGIIEDY